MTRFLLLVLSLLLVSTSCAPVKISDIRFPRLHSFLDRSAGRGLQPAQPTVELLKQLGLEKVWSSDPERVILTLQSLAAQDMDREMVGAMAELAFTQARRNDKDPVMARKWYLATTMWSYAYLFHYPSQVEEEMFNPRAHQQISLYNLSLGKFLSLLDNDAVSLTSHQEQVLDKVVRIDQVVEAGMLDPASFTEAATATEIRAKGFRNRHKRWGLGIPITFYRENGQATVEETYLPPEGIVYPGTAVLYCPPPGRDGVLQARLCYYDPRDAAHTKIGNRKVPLAGDLTTPYGYLLERANLKRLGRQGLLNSEKTESHRGVFLLEPYDRNKIPLVMVHGLMSSPLAWMELTNDLNGDPQIRNRFQIWHYMYPTSAPYLYSARLFRRDLEKLRRDLDPDGDDPAMDGMVFAAHSMGGLLTKTLAVSSGDLLWDTVFEVGPDQLAGDPEDIQTVTEIFKFKPKTYARRIIFISVPHRGSHFATNLLGRMGSGLVDLPDEFLNLIQRLAVDNEADLTPQMREVLIKGGPTSIQALSPQHPLLNALADIPVSHQIPVHSIMGDRGKSDARDPGDGIVTLASSRLDEAASELVIPSTHDSATHPAAILEIKRILQLHLRSLE